MRNELRSSKAAHNTYNRSALASVQSVGVAKKLLQIAALLFLAVCLQMPAHAQRIDPLNVEPDANGVDMLSGRVSRPIPILAIPAVPNLRLERLQMTQPVLTGSASGNDPSQGSIQLNNGTGTSESFQCLGDDCWPRTYTGSTLIYHGGSGALRSYTYMQGGTGMVIEFDSVGNLSDDGGTESFSIYPSSISWPNGESLDFTYDKVAWGDNDFRHRPTKITSNLGYEMQFSYAAGSVNTANWVRLTYAAIFRSADISTALASHTYGTGTPGTITDLAGRTWSCCADALDEQIQVSAVAQRLPDLTTDSFVATASSNGRYVSGIESDGVDWTYVAVETTVPDHCYPDHCDLDQITITGPDHFERVVMNDVSSIVHLAPVVASVTNRINALTTYTTTYSYDGQRRLTGITYPRGNGVSVAYDNYANITSRSAVPTSGIALTQTANFTTPSGAPGPTNPGCANVTCFLPNWTRDEANFQTDYIWEVHGGMRKSLEPTGANGLRRLTHRFYQQSSGNVYRVSTERVCGIDASTPIASAACPSTEATQVTSYLYWNDTLLPIWVTRTNLAGTLSARTIYTYDNAGRVLSEDGPLAGVTDATYYRYDTAGRQVQVVGPEIGNAARRAGTNTTYRDADDQPILAQTGYYTSATDPTITATSEVLNTYNNRRLVTRSDTIDAVNSTTEAVMQFTYDARNQLQCGAQRMNPAQYTSLPSSACNLGTTGSMGPDRIQRHWYDWFGRRYLTRAGYRVLNGGLGEDVFRMTWTNNGQVNWRRDGNANQTNYTYDVYDRPLRTTFPDATYEELGYNSRSLVTQMLNRRGQTITNSYDNTGRVTQTSYSTSDPSINYTYDGLGRQTQVARTGRSTLDYRYDGLGRRDRVTQTDLQVRELNYQYDIAGRRTRLTWDDDFSVTYDYAPAGNVTAIREDGGTALASYSYSAEGWLDQIDRANGVSTYVTRDNLARPTRLRHDGLGYSDFTYNPSSQILTRTISNNQNVWDHDVNVDLDYAINTLNQYTSAGSTNFTYDNSGNMTASGSDSFAYDPVNRMTSATVDGGTLYNLRYDGLGRPFRTWGNGEASTYYTYDGDALVAEYNVSGTMLRRYIHGPGVDDPILWYEGASTAASNRQFLHADERGSITVITDNRGAVVNRNTYDDWGIPAPGNIGRFGYTGQMWLDAIGLNYYKARIYSPTLGRFMQTDPIGYADGMNMYAYVGNDPMNWTDPTGLASGPDCKSRANCEVADYGGSVNSLKGREARRNSTQRPAGNGQPGIGHNGGPPLEESTLSRVGRWIFSGGRWVFRKAILGGALWSTPVAEATLPPPNYLSLARSQGTQVSGRFPSSVEGSQILYRQNSNGEITNYQSYGADGLPDFRVDLVGRSHGGIPTPHTLPFGRNQLPDGSFRERPLPVRPARPNEVR